MIVICTYLLLICCFPAIPDMARKSVSQSQLVWRLCLVLVAAIDAGKPPAVSVIFINNIYHIISIHTFYHNTQVYGGSRIILTFTSSTSLPMKYEFSSLVQICISSMFSFRPVYASFCLCQFRPWHPVGINHKFPILGYQTPKFSLTVRQFCRAQTMGPMHLLLVTYSELLHFRICFFLWK